MLGPFWKKNCALRNVYLSHDDPAVFITCQWQKNKTEPNLMYLIYRTIVMLIFVVTWIMSIHLERGEGKWAIYLTNWGYTGCTLQALIVFIMLSAALLATYFKNMSKVKQNVLKMYPVYWLLNTVATPTAFAITTIYWSVIYNAKQNKLDAMNYFVHGNNTILMFLDLWIVSHPIRILHVIYTMLLGLTYTFFTLIYFSAGGTNKTGASYIYKIVDWTKPGVTTGTCLGVIAFLIVLHMIIFLFSCARRNLEEKCCGKQVDISMSDTKRQKAAYVNEAMSTDVV